MRFCIIFLIFAHFGILRANDRVNYGNVYIKNNTSYALKVTANVKDAWDRVTRNDWQIPKDGAEKIDNLFMVSNISFQPVVADESEVGLWLRKKHSIKLEPKKEGKDLIIYIAKSRYGNRWNIDKRYVTSANIEYGGPSGYHVRVEIP